MPTYFTTVLAAENASQTATTRDEADHVTAGNPRKTDSILRLSVFSRCLLKTLSAFPQVW